MAIKTRERLIEVARQLFARKGVENTTMLDIANASDKGRRTLYTYFKNKREIQQAVIESESEQLVARERSIKESALSPTLKIESFVRLRLEALVNQPSVAASEQLSIRNILESNRTAKIRRLAAEKDLDIFNQILRQGVECGEFDPQQAGRVSALAITMLHAVSNPMVRENLGLLGYSPQTAIDSIVAFITRGLTTHTIPRNEAANYSETTIVNNQNNI